jgi:hypothetical protein
MPSTYSPSLRLELIADNEQAGVWGQTTNRNFVQVFEEAIVGVTEVDVTAGNVTLTASNGQSDQSRRAFIVITGTPVAARTVTAADVNKLYFVQNQTGQTVTFRGGAQTGVSIPAGTFSYVRLRAGLPAQQVQLLSPGGAASFASLSVSGATTLNNGLTVSGATTLNNGLTVSGATSLASLSVSGGANLASLSVSGATTLTGTLTANAGATLGPSVISVNTSSTAFRVTQTGSGEVVRFEDSANPDSSPFVIDADGAVLIGDQAAGGLRFVAGSTALLRHQPATGGSLDIETVPQDGTSTASIRLFRNTNTTAGAVLTILRGDNTTISDHRFSTGSGTASRAELARNGGIASVGRLPSTSITLCVNASTGASEHTRSVQVFGELPPAITGSHISFQSAVSTAAATFTAQHLTHFEALQLPVGAGSSISSQIGFYVHESLTGATTNIGFSSNIPAGAGRWNFYASSGASNFFAGPVYLGHAANLDYAGVTPRLQVSGTTIGNASASFAAYANDSFTSPILFLGKSRSTAIGGNALVADNDLLGTVRWTGADGDEFHPGAEIGARVDGTPGNNNMPGRLEFRTTPSGNITPQLRWLIDSVGRLRPGSNGGTIVNKVQTVTSGPSITIDARLGNVVHISPLTSNVTNFSITNPQDGMMLSIRFEQYFGGGCTVAMPSGWKIVGSLGLTAQQVSYLNITYVASAGVWEGSWLALPL